jgi:hypothetical protein
MRLPVRTSMLALGMMVTAAAAQSAHRLVVVIGRPDDPRIGQQHAALVHDAAALRERDVVVQDLTPDAARRERPELDVSPQADFEVLVVGKDGGVKLRRPAPVTASDIMGLIDAMPMRRAEMRR